MRDPNELRRSLAVYVVTSSGMVPGRDHLDVARAAIEGGATAIQLRAPELADRPEEVARLAGSIDELPGRREVLFVVNNVIDVVAVSGADGVHLGQGDEVEGARSRLGPDGVLGVSVGSPDQARAAERRGADYLGVTVFSTGTKPEATPIGLHGLQAVVAATPLPVVGIGGIDASNAGRVLSAGAAGVAVVSAVGGAKDPHAATRDLVAAVADYLGIE
jgi:thiamine-phosphate pyrophosphorylase